MSLVYLFCRCERTEQDAKVVNDNASSLSPKFRFTIGVWVKPRGGVFDNPLEVLFHLLYLVKIWNVYHFRYIG